MIQQYILFSDSISVILALEIKGCQRLLAAGIWYMTAQKVFTMIKMTAEFPLVSKIKFSFNLGSISFY